MSGADCIHVYASNTKIKQVSVKLTLERYAGIRYKRIPMRDEVNNSKQVVISTRTDADTQKQIDNEARLREHTRSQALEHIIKLGLPRYLKRFPKKLERIDSAAA